MINLPLTLEIQKRLGNQYLWDEELWYYGHPLHQDHWTGTERKAITEAQATPNS